MDEVEKIKERPKHAECRYTEDELEALHEIELKIASLQCFTKTLNMTCQNSTATNTNGSNSSATMVKAMPKFVFKLIIVSN